MMTPQSSRSIARNEDSPPRTPAAEPLERTLSFGDQLKALRRRTWCKQAVLSDVVGCSEAAISFWESGARLPKKRMLGLLLTALAREGVSPLELYSLSQRWRYERNQRELTHALSLTRERPHLS